MSYHTVIDCVGYHFPDLKTLLAKASPMRSADVLARVAAQREIERVAAKIILSDVPLKNFLSYDFVPYESDEVTQLIFDSHNATAFKIISHLTVGEFRDWLLSPTTTTQMLNELSSGLTPEMVAAVSKLMRIQDLIAVSKKCIVISKFRNTLGLAGCFSSRLQPNHPTDDVPGILASILDGLLLGSGDAVIGINPAFDSPEKVTQLLMMLDECIQAYNIPTQSCVLTHVTTTTDLIKQGVPVDLVFQSIAGSQKANASFGINLQILAESQQAALSLKRGTKGNNVMYFETGQGSALSADAHFDVDAQTMEARAYAVARQFSPLLMNSVVGFIGPEYLYDGKQIIRAGLEDLFCGKMLGLPMGCDVCYTNHAEACQDDMDTLLTLLAAAGCNYVMGIPGADDIMLNYQSTSFHDILSTRHLFNLKPAPEFEEWLIKMKIYNPHDKQFRKSAKQLEPLYQSLIPERSSLL